MITVDNTLYVLAGIEGKLFVTNGTAILQTAKIPSTIMNIDGGKFLTTYPGAIISHQGKIFFGVGSGNSINGSGVYSFTKGVENGLVLENIISTGGDGSTTAVEIGALLSTNRDIFLVGWRDDTTYGIDKINNSARYTSYAAFIKSPLYLVGSSLINRSFNTIEVQLDKPLTTGQGVRVGYVKNLTDAFTTIFTFDFVTFAGLSSYTTDALIADAEFVQIKVELTTGAASNTSPELRRITLI